MWDRFLDDLRYRVFDLAAHEIDFATPALRLVLMRRAGSLIALLLVILWLPATQRCALVAAGLLHPDGAQDGAECDCPPGTPCGKDDCQNLEQNLAPATFNQLGVAVPEAVLCTCHICLRSSELSPVAVAAAKPRFFIEPFALARPWQFQRRAAPYPRSPTSA